MLPKSTENGILFLVETTEGGVGTTLVLVVVLMLLLLRSRIFSSPERRIMRRTRTRLAKVCKADDVAIETVAFDKEAPAMVQELSDSTLLEAGEIRSDLQYF